MEIDAVRHSAKYNDKKLKLPIWGYGLIIIGTYIPIVGIIATPLCLVFIYNEEDWHLTGGITYKICQVLTLEI